MTTRSFLALVPDARARGRLRALQQDVLGTSSRWRLVAPSALHLTLAFLGDRSAAELADLASRAASLDFQPLTLVTADWLALPPARPRALAIAIAASPELMQLGKAVDVIVRDVGLELESREWLPHVTLARARDGLPEPVASVAGQSLRCARIGLFASDQTGSGVRYRPLWQIAED